MNGEILFRGKRLGNNEWLYGSHFTDSGEDYIIPQNLLGINDYEEYQVDQNTVGQFTGMTDKNGVKIFDGDIIRIYDSDYEEYSDHQVKFAHGVFGIDNWTGRLLTTLSFFMCCGNDSEYSVEVIGNIYDNQELLSAK